MQPLVARSRMHSHLHQVNRVDIADRSEGGVTMTLVSTFASLESLEQMMAMGMEQGLREVSSTSREIGMSVAEAVRCLQFEDISTQALGTAAQNVQRLTAMTEQAETLHRLVAEPPSDDLEPKRPALENWKRQTESQVQVWAVAPHKPPGPAPVTGQASRW